MVKIVEVDSLVVRCLSDWEAQVSNDTVHRLHEIHVSIQISEKKNQAYKC
mgnify:CR=1 FL=1